MTSLNWIPELLNKLPDLPARRRSMIEIAGYPRWENVISNFLAFYLDKDEEHGLGTLFFHALLDELEPHISADDLSAMREDNYTVAREVSTNKGRLDLLITSKSSLGKQPSWAIIIEHKVDAPLYNELEDYWISTKADLKFGVVLSLKPVHKAALYGKTCTYVPMLHETLIQRLQPQLGAQLLEADDRHLLFLKDYLLNLDNMATQRKDQPEIERQMLELQAHKKDIDQLEQLKGSVSDYAVGKLIQVMDDFGYDASSPGTRVQGKHFWAREDQALERKAFRFYVELDDLRWKHELLCYFELVGDYTRYGKRIKAQLKEEGYFNVGFVSSGGSEKSGWFHLANIWHGELNKEMPLREALTESLKKAYFGESSVVKRSVELLNQYLKEA